MHLNAYNDGWGGGAEVKANLAGLLLLESPERLHSPLGEKTTMSYTLRPATPA